MKQTTEREPAIEASPFEKEPLIGLAQLDYLHTDNKRPLSVDMIAGQLEVEPEEVLDLFYALDQYPISFGVAPRRREAFTHKSIVQFNIATAEQKKTDIEDGISNEEWVDRMANASDELGISEIAKLMDRSMGWVSKMVRQLEVEPITHVLLYGRYVAKYNELAPITLREYEQQWPRHGGWFNTLELQNIFQEDREWIANRLINSGIPTEQRWSTSNRLIYHYPPEALGILLEAQNNWPARAKSGWYTENALIEMLDRSTNWITPRLSGYVDTGIIMLDERGVPRTHYPEEVLEQLGQDSQVYPDAEQDMTLSALAKSLGKHANWVSNRLTQAGIIPETKQDSLGRPKSHYPRFSYYLLKQELEDLSYPPAEDFLVMTDLEAAVGRTSYWIERRLGILSVSGELRRNNVHRLWMHYPPEVVEHLRELSERSKSKKQYSEIQNIVDGITLNSSPEEYSSIVARLNRAKFVPSLLYLARRTSKFDDEINRFIVPTPNVGGGNHFLHFEYYKTGFQITRSTKRDRDPRAFVYSLSIPLGKPSKNKMHAIDSGRSIEVAVNAEEAMRVERFKKGLNSGNSERYLYLVNFLKVVSNDVLRAYKTTYFNRPE